MTYISSLQKRIFTWCVECFGAEDCADMPTRNQRFLEEALEMVQANNCTASEAHQLVDYVFSRPKGDPKLEAGQVVLTLAALCNVLGVDMLSAAETELNRVWCKLFAIREKHQAKPKASPLPVPHWQTRLYSDGVDLSLSLNYLLNEEASTVALVPPNYDCSGPAQAIVCSGEWSNYMSTTVYGENLAECFDKAHEAKSNFLLSDTAK